MSTAIEFNHVSKQYRLGLVSTRTLSHDLQRWWTMNIRGKEDPYLKIGETNDRSTKGSSDYVWALKDIDFKVEQGDVVGIIGKNGAGKSTLLKLLSKVTGPTTGTIKARGRIGALLEVGTGFHSEMTGRENIYLNGAILGMSRQEISRKLDEIVDFSGCERYIDTPVKRYSSGMMVRLGFAVAAHLDPEILVVDEVLAVGDAEFQKKAIGKMKEVSEGEGRTVLFVSHNMTSIRNLCKSGIILEKGNISFIGFANDAVDQYISGNLFSFTTEAIVDDSYRLWYVNKNIEFLNVRLRNPSASLYFNEPIELEIKLRKNRPNCNSYNIVVIVSNAEEKHIGSYISPLQNFSDGTKESIMRITIHNHNLAKGKYYLSFNVGLNSDELGIYDIDYDEITMPISFEIAGKDSTMAPIIHWARSLGNFCLNDGTIERI